MNQKLEDFKKRNQTRNAHLYQLDKIEGIDYIVCPISQERLSMIKSTYIERVLDMTVTEYNKLYPGIKGVSKARKDNIKAGLQKIDSLTGLTKYEKAQQKARETLKSIDKDGLSGYKKKGQKTRNTHMTRIDELGRNGYQRQADYRLTTVLDNGLTIEQNAHLKQKESLIKNKKTGSGGASILSKKILKPIIDWLDKNKIKYYFDKNEYGIKDTDTGNFYFWDLTIPNFNMVIEYQSTAWHADPRLDEIEWNSWKPPFGKKRLASEVLEYDYKKARSIFKHRNFTTFYVWQRTQHNDVGELLCLLETPITKY